MKKWKRDITYMGKRKYVHDYAFDDVQPITCDFVPDNINDITVYIVILQASEKMKKCIGRKLWGFCQTSKNKPLTKRQRQAKIIIQMLRKLLLYKCKIPKHYRLWD